MVSALEGIYTHPWWTTLWILIIFASLEGGLKGLWKKEQIRKD